MDTSSSTPSCCELESCDVVFNDPADGLISVANQLPACTHPLVLNTTTTTPSSITYKLSFTPIHLFPKISLNKTTCVYLI